MARTSEKVGRGPCPQCGERLAFHRTAGGLLNYDCQACDHQAYAHKNGAAEKKWLASMDPAEPTPAPAPAPEPTPAPVKVAKKNSVFAMGDL